MRVFHGFPWADIGLPSPTVLCHTKVSDGASVPTAEATAQLLAQNIAQQVAAMIWEIREEFLPPTPQPSEVCEQVRNRNKTQSCDLALDLAVILSTI